MIQRSVSNVVIEFLRIIIISMNEMEIMKFIFETHLVGNSEIIYHCQL